jgi:transcriptional regulator with PAS, ATPase and Fis domain
VPPGFVLDDTARVSTGLSAVRILSVELAVVEGPSRGARVTLTGPLARVGTAEGSELRINDPSVSRVHCELTVGTAEVTLRDLGSTNGTWIDDVRVREVEVPIGTVVRLGRSAFRIEAGDASGTLALSEASQFGELVGDSLEMRSVYAILERAAPTDTTLLLQGETGTGKDVAARSVHAASRRASGPFVPVDCGAIPENLIESELFGHVRGAFTGAVQTRVGAFEEAAGGTLFLDEIGEMPLSMQPKLLRAIESRAIKRVGAPATVPVDVRIIAATNRSLARCVNEGTFREDLYYRLAVVEVSLPPLRARRDDIPSLAARIVEQLTGRTEPLAPDFVEMLRRRAWRGNVRELRNFLERAVTLGQLSSGPGASPPAAPAVLPEGIERIVPLHLPLKEARDAWMQAFESIYVRAMMDRTSGNLKRAAELAGVSRRFLQRLIARLGLRGDEAAADDDDDGDEGAAG